MTKMTYDTVETQASYGIGLELGQQLKGGGLKDYLVPDALLAGIVDSIRGNELAVEVNVIHNALRELQEKSEPVRQDMQKASTEKGRDFLVKNAQQPGVVVTSSGLQYKVIREGEGERPSLTSRVKLHYVGKNVDEQVFDSTRARGIPLEFVVSGSVKGLQEAILLMPVGSKWEVYIPPELGYGDQNGGALLPPQSMLIFELELINIL